MYRDIVKAATTAFVKTASHSRKDPSTAFVELSDSINVKIGELYTIQIKLNYVTDHSRKALLIFASTLSLL